MSTEEWESTAELMQRLREARRRGYLTAAELEAICRWKSPRVIRHIRRNSAASIQRATGTALATRSERIRIVALTSLHGVSIPMASAILTLLDPRRYGVLDIRAWQLLHKLGAVTGKPGGAGFVFENWNQFLTILRGFARELHVKARDIERTLFNAHKLYQEGKLYGVRGGPASAVPKKKTKP